MRELSEGSGVQKKAWTSGGLHSWANPDGTQKIKDTGPLTKKRIETVDEEILDLSLGFIDKSAKDNKPFFCWFNSTRMHVFTPPQEGATARRPRRTTPQQIAAASGGSRYVSAGIHRLHGCVQLFREVARV
jgi:arylsulfatase A-like enzyme